MSEIMPTHPNQIEIWESLAALLRRGKKDSFVIIEEAATKKYVQFGMGPCLVLDVPCVALTPKEAERASHFFKKYGVTAPREYESPNSETGRTEYGAAFRHDFGRDTVAACQAVLDAFGVIYDFPSDVHLIVRES